MSSENKSFYVYELWNPLKNEIFYVGKGTKIIFKNRNKGYYRLSEHIKDTRYYKAGKYKRNHKYTTIAKIIDSGYKPDIKIVFESDNEKDAIQKEIELIRFYGRRDNGTGILVNHTDGGEGMTGYKHTADHIKKLKNDNPGGKATAIPIIAICPDSNTIKHKFDSASNAALKLVNNAGAKSNINLCCRKNKHRTAYGYYWRYENEYDSSEDVRQYNEYRTNLSVRRAEKIEQQDSQGNIIRIWDSASQVCRHYGKGVSTLHRYIKNNKPWEGFYWKKCN